MLYVSQPGIGDICIRGVPETRASVEDSPPGFEINISLAFMYFAMSPVNSKGITLSL